MEFEVNGRNVSFNLKVPYGKVNKNLSDICSRKSSCEIKLELKQKKIILVFTNIGFYKKVHEKDPVVG